MVVAQGAAAFLFVFMKLAYLLALSTTVVLMTLHSTSNHSTLDQHL